MLRPDLKPLAQFKAGQPDIKRARLALIGPAACQAGLAQLQAGQVRFLLGRAPNRIVHVHVHFDDNCMARNSLLLY